MSPMSRALLRIAAISVLGSMSTNCMDPAYNDTTDSGCAGPVEPGQPYEPQPAHWARIAAFQNPVVLSAVWTSSPSLAYAVGDAGTIVRVDSYGNLNPTTSGTSENLRSVWGNNTADLFAAGDAGTILHSDGLAWSVMQSPTTATLRDLWGEPGHDVFAVGDGGTILRYSNDSWTTMTSGVSANLNAVWGASSQNVFAVGDGGTVVRYDGTQWKLLHPGTTEDLLGVWVGPGGSAAVVGRNGTFLTRASGWHSFEAPPFLDLTAVWGSDFNDLHVVGGTTFLRFNGESVRSMVNSSVTGSLTALHGETRFDIMGVSDDGSIYRFYPKQ